MRTLFSCVVLVLYVPSVPAADEPAKVTPQEVLDGLQRFWAKTALPDGSFRPGVDPDYKGMSDSALSDSVSFDCDISDCGSSWDSARTESSDAPMSRSPASRPCS